MTRRIVLSSFLVFSFLFALIAAPAASAAVQRGAYKGESQAVIVAFGVGDPPSSPERTDRGKVTFSVRNGKVRDFTVRGQQAKCGPGASDLDFKIGSISLNREGKGKATYTEPNIYTKIEVTIKVTSRGTAKGQINFGQICETTASFTAKR